MPKEQLSLSFEKHTITVLHVVQGDEGRYSIEDCQTLRFPFDLYADVLEAGQSKGMLAVTNELNPILSRFQTSRLSVSVNMDRTKCLDTHINRNLSPDEFAYECEDEASKFLRDPSDYNWQSIRLKETSDAPYEKHLLVFMPKRFLTRLEMMILPCQKEINLIDGSHMSFQNLYRWSGERRILIELEEHYMAISLFDQACTESFAYWNLSSETDAAYFTLTELRKLDPDVPISITGSSASREAIQFLSSVIEKQIDPVATPNVVSAKCRVDDSPRMLKALGCAIKALSEF
ncbi:MAG: hypothetical protein HGB19_01170 [Chlorobiales bacterium]|jgi:hypothetical protein|nr:hypothetical protein [Chlorobiales bacterium]